MSRNVFIWLSFASALGLYLLGGIITYIDTQIVGGLLRSSHLVMALGVFAFTAIFLASIVFLMIWFGGNKLGFSEKRMPLGVAGKTIFIALSIAALLGGVATGLISSV